jgi:methenyltetrahydrofolate cyclohydrolase
VPEGLRPLLDEVASTESVPAGGSIAAATVAMAAALLVKAAKLSREHWTEAEAEAAVTAADAARLHAASLVDADADAYRALQAARREARDLVEPGRTKVIEVPLAIVRTAAEVTELADTLAARGNPRLRGDAVVAAILAAAAAQGAAELVAINLSSTPDDQRLTEARTLAQEARRRADWLRPPPAPRGEAGRGG